MLTTNFFFKDVKGHYTTNFAWKNFPRYKQWNFIEVRLQGQWRPEVGSEEFRWWKSIESDHLSASSHKRPGDRAVWGENSNRADAENNEKFVIWAKSNKHWGAWRKGRFITWNWKSRL